MSITCSFLAQLASLAIGLINLEGPFDIFYVSPADDPQRRQTTLR